MSHAISTIPGPRGHFLLGSIPEIMKDRVQFLVDLQRDHGDIVQIRLGPFNAILLFHPDGIQHILQDNHINYSKETRTYANVSAIAGNGLICSNGDFWLRQRRLMQPAFHQNQINLMSDMMCREANLMFERWEPYIRDGQTINIAHEMMRLTLSVATQALFGNKVHDPDRLLATNISFLMKDTAFRFEHPFYPPRWVPASRNRQFNAAMKNFNQVIYSMIAERRSNPHDQALDLLDILMNAREEENGEMMNDLQLRDEVATLFLAGHETSAVALSWTLYLLSEHPEIETRLRGELQQVLAGREPTLADLPNLPYTRMVVEESMRLYPPAWLTERKALADDEIGGYRIPAGVTLAVSPYVTHRHPQFWKDPDAFDPEHFAPQNSEKRPRYAYFPFGGGPRQCIGKNMALLEIQLVLPMILQHCRLKLAPGWEVKTEPELSLRLKGGLWMQLKPA